MGAKQPRRKSPPPDVEKTVLTKSRRRCALCFHLQGDTAEKKGQIAHLDRRRSNSIEDNLAFLCLDHHSEYDSTTSQHKNYTIDEVKTARGALYEWVKRRMSPTPRRSPRPTTVAQPVPVPTKPTSATTSNPNRPAIRLHFKNAQLARVATDEYDFVQLRNVGGRAATNLQVEQTCKGQYRVEFEPVNCIGRHESVALKHRTYRGDSFLGASTNSRPEFGLKELLDNTLDDVLHSFLSLTIRYLDTDGTELCTRQTICYDPLQDEVTRVSTEECGAQPTDRPEVALSRCSEPILSYQGVTNARPWSVGPMGECVPQVVRIKNTQISVENTANNVVARIEYVHANGDRFVIREAPWIEVKSDRTGRNQSIRLCSAVFLRGDEEQSVVFLLLDRDRRLMTSADMLNPLRELPVGHCTAKITVSADNCRPLPGEIGFTLLPEGRLVYDQPVFLYDATNDA